MKGQFGVMVDLEEALWKLEESDLYSAGLSFFSALGYPVEPLTSIMNESMLRFVYVIDKSNCTFSSDEINAMRNVISISWLFTLNRARGVWVEDIYVSCINYFCVELDCTLHDRSILAFILTNVTSKVVRTPVVVLFKHANYMVLSSVFMVHGELTSAVRTYMSDWHPINPVEEHVLITLSNWNSGYYCDDDLYMFYMDFVHSMSRSYLLDSQSYSYYRPNKNFLWNSIALKGKSYYEEVVLNLNGVRYSFSARPTEIDVERDPREIYGYDYVHAEDIEIFADDSNWVLEELLDLDETMDSTINDEFDDEAELDDEIDMVSYQFDIDSIDEAVFQNPIKMLEYIVSLEHRER